MWKHVTTCDSLWVDVAALQGLFCCGGDFCLTVQLLVLLTTNPGTNPGAAPLASIPPHQPSAFGPPPALPSSGSHRSCEPLPHASRSHPFLPVLLLSAGSTLMASSSVLPAQLLASSLLSLHLTDLSSASSLREDSLPDSTCVSNIISCKRTWPRGIFS